MMKSLRNTAGNRFNTWISHLTSSHKHRQLHFCLKNYRSKVKSVGQVKRTDQPYLQESHKHIEYFSINVRSILILAKYANLFF